jgi:hypothetical protein
MPTSMYGVRIVHILVALLPSSQFQRWYVSLSIKQISNSYVDSYPNQYKNHQKRKRNTPMDFDSD